MILEGKVKLHELIQGRTFHRPFPDLLDREAREERWRHNGKEFGYPQCCIDWFCAKTTNSECQKKVANKHGFIPCPTHTSMILEGKIKLHELIQGRSFHRPFPHSTPSRKK
jgi:hypothetical protein